MEVSGLDPRCMIRVRGSQETNPGVSHNRIGVIPRKIWPRGRDRAKIMLKRGFRCAHRWKTAGKTGSARFLPRNRYSWAGHYRFDRSRDFLWGGPALSIYAIKRRTCPTMHVSATTAFVLLGRGGHLNYYFKTTVTIFKRGRYINIL